MSERYKRVLPKTRAIRTASKSSLALELTMNVINKKHKYQKNYSTMKTRMHSICLP